MSVLAVLAVHVDVSTVTSSVVADDGTTVATDHRPLSHHAPEPGWVEHAPEELWRAVLEATRGVLGQADSSQVRGVDVTTAPDTVVLWDRDTLGSPRRAIAGADRRTTSVCARLRNAGHEERVLALTGRRLEPGLVGPALTWIAEHEQHTWALVESGRYAVGTVGSYLVARMTRGLEHVLDRAHAERTLLLDVTAGAWSEELCAIFGVPVDALPELVAGVGGADPVAVTDPRTFVDLALPITSLGTA